MRGRMAFGSIKEAVTVGFGMATVKWDYGKWDGIMGYTCGQCGVIKPHLIGGVQHEIDIDDNGGICPNTG